MNRILVIGVALPAHDSKSKYNTRINVKNNKQAQETIKELWLREYEMELSLVCTFHPETHLAVIADS